jgi:hypothetical protein
MVKRVRKKAKLIGSVRTCIFFNECNNSEPYNGKRWKIQWMKYQDGYICRKHYDKLFLYPRWNKILSPRRIQFKNYRIGLKHNIRTGYCSRCPNNIHDGSCKRTSVHHWVYIIILPWFGTEEICNKCHMVETWKLKQVKPTPRKPQPKECFLCKRPTTSRDKKGSYRWSNYKVDDGRIEKICDRCYMREKRKKNKNKA